MADKIMKTLTIGDNTYEIVDESARNSIDNLNESIDDLGEGVGNLSKNIGDLNELDISEKENLVLAINEVFRYSDARISDVENRLNENSGESGSGSENNGGSTSGGVTSWNDLADKPFYPPVIYYEWNEETVYDTTIALPDGGYAMQLAKISDDTPTSDFFIGKYVYAKALYNDEVQSMEQIISSNMISVFSEEVYSIGNGMLYVVLADSVDLEGLTLTKGMWCMDGWDSSSGMAYLNLKFKEQGKMIDESVIPDTIARTSDIEHYTYGTEDLVAGTSELATGKLYFVYE